jgi:MFS family permease
MDIVLFGGALGSLYSLLQFIIAPFMGRLSDRIGRKKTLLVSLVNKLIEKRDAFGPNLMI